MFQNISAFHLEIKFFFVNRLLNLIEKKDKKNSPIIGNFELICNQSLGLFCQLNRFISREPGSTYMRTERSSYLVLFFVFSKQDDALTDLSILKIKIEIVNKDKNFHYNTECQARKWSL